MTVRFANPDDLKQALDQVSVQKVGNEELTANGCVLLEQLEFDTTQLTTIEPGKAVFRRKIQHLEAQSGGRAGTKFLVDLTSLKSKLSLMKDAGANSLTLQLIRGTLKVRADLSVINGKEKERGNLSCKLYPGALSDFQVQNEASNLVARVEHNAFNLWVSLLNDFGDFSSENMEGLAAGRTIVVTLDSAGSIEGLTNNKNAYGAYLKIVLPAEIPDNSSLETNDDDDEEDDDDDDDEYSTNKDISSNLKFAIEGKYVKRLAKLTKDAPIEIFRSRNWVTFKGDLGSTTIRTFDPSLQLLRDYQLFSPDPRWVVNGSRGCTLEDLHSAVAMQSANEGGRSDLAVVEKIPNFVVVPAQNITGSDCAYVGIDPTNVDGEWHPIVFSSIGIKAAIKALRVLSSRQRLSTSSVTLTQKYVTRPSGTRTWLLYLNFSGLDASLAGAADVTCLLFARDLTQSLDLLEADE